MNVSDLHDRWVAERRREYYYRLAKMHADEDSLLRDIMASEINYARTKQFWD